MEECYPDTIEVAGSSPAVITNWFVTQLDKSTGLLHREFGVRIPAGQQRMKSSMVEQRFVKPLVEGSNPSSSARRAGRHGCMRPAANRKKEVRIFCTTQLF